MKLVFCFDESDRRKIAQIDLYYNLMMEANLRDDHQSYFDHRDTWIEELRDLFDVTGINGEALADEIIDKIDCEVPSYIIMQMFHVILV